MSDAAERMYQVLALFDRRQGDYIDALVQTVREGYERDEDEPDTAFAEFDRLWGMCTSAERLEAAR